MDRRTKYTKKIIKDTFIELLQQKEINKITVSEICKKADINRATFYRYYLDIYDLLDKIKEELIEELKQAPLNDSEYTVSSFSVQLLNVFLNYKELIKTLFIREKNIFFLNEVLEVAYEKSSEKWLKDIPNLDIASINYASVFIFNGALGIINYWIQNDFNTSVEEIASTIEKLSYYGIKKYIYKK